MTRIELIFDSDCPNVDAAREQIGRALDGLRLPSEWVEWNRADPKAPSYVQRHGSPTVLVDGRDIVGSDHTTDSSACRIYFQPDGTMSGVPDWQDIRSALERATDSTH